MGGLPEGAQAGDPEADRGLFGRLTELILADAPLRIRKAGSAV